MKSLAMVSFLIASLTSGFLIGEIQASQQSPLLVVLLMVKNEKEVIIPTLETLVSKNPTSDPKEVAYVLYDTGSTDDTTTLAKDFFVKNGIKRFRIETEEFVDFATSRNRALALARTSYPSSTFILFPDAEWYMHNFDDLLTFCREKKAAYEKGEKAPPYYSIRMSRPSYISLTSRLFLTHDSVEFEGVVHECPTKLSEEKVPTKIYFDLGMSKFGTDKSRQRWHRDRQLLLKDLQAHPDNSRTALYLGLTESWLEDYENAYIHLKQRVSMRSFPEEEFWAMYNLAEVVEALAKEKPDTYSWKEAHDYYLQAYAMRPHRAEPLVRIADHYLEKGEYSVSFIYARRAAELPIPTPENEILPVLTQAYTFERWELLSRAAWYVQEYELGEKAAKMAIEANPNAQYLYSNLSYYWERKSQGQGA